MMLERTISQLDIGHVPDDVAEQMGHLGYTQWLGALRGGASYAEEAWQAYAMAHPFIAASPAISVFCDLLITSAADPLVPLDLKLPARRRRGGAKARRGRVA